MVNRMRSMLVLAAIGAALAAPLAGAQAFPSRPIQFVIPLSLIHI